MWYLRIKRLIVILPFLLGFLLFPGCGYHLQHRLKDTFKSDKGIFIRMFDNRTDEIGAERVFTNALIRELSSRHEAVLTDRKSAGVEIQGVITKIDSSPTAFTGLGFKGLQAYRRLPSEWGVRVSLQFFVRDLKTEQLVWSKELSGFRRINAPLNRTNDFEAPSSIGVMNQSIVESLYADIARDVTRDLYDEMVEWF